MKIANKSRPKILSSREIRFFRNEENRDQKESGFQSRVALKTPVIYEKKSGSNCRGTH